LEAHIKAAGEMIGADTKILVRYLVEDDKAQTEEVHRLLAAASSSGETVYVSLIVLCEAYWVLRTVFDRPKSAILEALETLLGVDVIQIEEPDVVRRALGACRRSKGDFADHLIGQLHAERGCRHTATFDRGLRGASGFVVL
jgi:predicted nucleic-acid-binding protein